jgi:TonB dependent receptor.
LTAFIKKFFHGLTSLIDSIPLASLGSDYGVIGDEEVRANSTGKAYGFELSGNWSINQKLSLISSYTAVRSLVKDLRSGNYVPSSWDSRHIFTASLMYSFPHNWDAGVKFRALGGSPYTPVDTEQSGLVQSWNRLSKSTLDYSRFNSKRLKPYTQLDIRIDKTYYWKNKMIGLYIDIQNLLNQKYKAPKEYISTGVIENPDAPLKEQRYRMKWLNKESGTILPTLGLTIEI